MAALSLQRSFSTVSRQQLLAIGRTGPARASRHEHSPAEGVTRSTKGRCPALRGGRGIALPIAPDPLPLETRLVLFHTFVHPEFVCAVTRKDHHTLNEDVAQAAIVVTGWKDNSSLALCKPR